MEQTVPSAHWINPQKYIFESHFAVAFGSQKKKKDFACGGETEKWHSTTEKNTTNAHTHAFETNLFRSFDAWAQWHRIQILYICIIWLTFPSNNKIIFNSLRNNGRFVFATGNEYPWVKWTAYCQWERVALMMPHTTQRRRTQCRRTTTFNSCEF